VERYWKPLLGNRFEGCRLTQNCFVDGMALAKFS
jgi:hypothetical protein